MIHMIFEMDTK